MEHGDNGSLSEKVAAEQGEGIDESTSYDWRQMGIYIVISRIALKKSIGLSVSTM